MENIVLYNRLEEEYRTVFLLEPEELRFLLDDLRGEEFTLEELAQVLLDGGLSYRYLAEKYLTGKGMRSLLNVVACQDVLEVDWDDLQQRVDDIAAGFYEFVKARLPPSLLETGGEYIAPLAEGESEDDGILFSDEEDEPPIRVSPDGKLSLGRGLAPPPEWDPSVCSESGLSGITRDDPYSRVMHDSQVEGAEHVRMPEEVLVAAERLRGLPPAELSLTKHGGFTPTAWLAVVKSTYTFLGGEDRTDILNLIENDHGIATADGGQASRSHRMDWNG
jgi:hypothetical protein